MPRGNLLNRAMLPAVFLADRGADAAPWRGPGGLRATQSGKNVILAGPEYDVSLERAVICPDVPRLAVLT